jgi:hypothetical protein
MFIDPTINLKICAPAERDVSGDGMRHRLTFRSSGAERSLFEVARSINISSLRDERTC